ncbi:MAG TPA: serine kinase, partial [Blastocatellia bacterium]|nr:serine kinase [Blastocatellia bacterium]
MVDSEPNVYSLYSTAKLFSDDLNRFPALQNSVGGSDDLFDEKKILFLHDEHADKIVRRLPVKAILLPKITRRRETLITESNASQALLALAPTVILQLLTNSEISMRKMSELVRQVPCFTLELGSELSEIPKVITNLLSNR